ncbi:MAG: Tn3 family transposase, partial [Rhodoluna sp.]
MPSTSSTALNQHALTQFPAVVPPADLIRYFQLSGRDLQQLDSLRGDYNRLGFALQLGTLRYLGFIPDYLSSIPQSVIDFVAHQLAIDSSAIARYGHRPQTRRHHRQAVEQYLGFQSCSQTVLVELQTWLLNRALEHDRPALLLELAVAKLYHDRVVRPGISTLERLITQVRTAAMQTTFEVIQPLLSPQHEAFLDGLLVVDETLGMTPLSWLRRPATMNSPKAILKTLAKLHFLNQHQTASWNLSHLNPNRVKFLAQLGKRSSNQVLQRTPLPRRYPILVAFICQIRTEVMDEAIDLFVRCLGDTYARARRYREAAHLEAEVALNEKVRLLHQVATVVLDEAVADEQVRTAIFERVPQPVLQAAIADCVRLMRPDPDHALDFFVARYSYLRQFIPAFLATLQFCSTLEPNPLLAALALLRQLDEQGKRLVPQDAPTRCIPAAWLPFLLDGTQQVRRRYYELGVLWQLRSALRSGTIWVEDSRRYAAPTAYLIPSALWPGLRAEFSQLLACPLQAQPRLQQLQNQFQAELERLNDALDDHDLLRWEQDQLVMSPLPAQEIPQSVTQLQTRLGRLLPQVDLGDLLVEVDLATQFSHCLTHAGGEAERSPETTVYLYAAILAQACNLGVQAMAQASDLSYERLLWHTHWFLRQETLAAAIDSLVNFQAQLPLAQC